MTFTFNKDYDDYEQVMPYYAKYLERYIELLRDGKYPYNDSFKGYLDIEADDRNEDSAIYLLQGLRRHREMFTRIERLLAQGYRQVDELDKTTKFEHIVLFPTRNMSGEWAEYREARLVPYNREKDVAQVGHAPYAVLPKGKRTHGYLVSGRSVLAK